MALRLINSASHSYWHIGGDIFFKFEIIDKEKTRKSFFRRSKTDNGVNCTKINFKALRIQMEYNTIFNYAFLTMEELEMYFTFGDFKSLDFCICLVHKFRITKTKKTAQMENENALVSKKKQRFE